MQDDDYRWLKSLQVRDERTTNDQGEVLRVWVRIENRLFMESQDIDPWLEAPEALDILDRLHRQLRDQLIAWKRWKEEGSLGLGYVGPRL